MTGVAKVRLLDARCSECGKQGGSNGIEEDWMGGRRFDFGSLVPLDALRDAVVWCTDCGAEGVLVATEPVA